ncbi:MAG: DNA polymerase II [Nannocystaceae bacterium]|nr:DNA polymerase II [Nannocystaceae bacterium]
MKPTTETVEAVLLTRQWLDRRDGLQLTFWGASAQGPIKAVLTGQDAVMFVQRATATQRGRRRPVALSTLHGAPVDAVYFDSQRALQAERGQIRSRSEATFEAAVKPDDRFLMERFVTGAFALHGIFRVRDGFREVLNPRVKTSEFSTPLSLLSFDIETVGLDGPLLSIAATGHGGDRVWIAGASDMPHEQYESVPDETALVQRFLEHVSAVDPDVLVGWNVVEFDLAYLGRKAKALGVPFTLGRGRERASVLAPRTDGQPYIARVPGRVVLDGIATLRAATFSFESFRLEDVAQTLLHRGKSIEHGGDPVAEIQRLYTHDKPALATYNLQDARLVRDIFAKADLVGFATERQSLTGLPLDRQGGSVAAFDNLYLPRLHRAGHVAPDVGDAGEVVASPGGWVMDSVPGLYDNVLVLDFKSLYPSIIRTFAIDPLGLATPGEDPIPGFEGGRFARTGHILPGLIEGLWTARDEAKRRDDTARSRAIKILMNSFYGVLGSGGCRFFDPRLPSSITLRGHEIIQQSRALIEAQGLQVIYGDTDSLFVHVGPQTPAACAATGERLAKDLNAHWTDHLASTYRIESHLELEFETHYHRFLMPTMRGSNKGSKKRYAGSLGPGPDAGLVIKGLEAVRTDWTPLARTLQRELLTRVFSETPWREWMAALARSVRAGERDEELVYRKRIRRRLDAYEHNVPPHIQAARKLGRPVREVRYVVTHRGAEPIELPHGRLDYEHYLSRQLAPAADCVLRFLDTSFAAVAGQQVTLFE